jgi:hypothetical protein
MNYKIIVFCVSIITINDIFSVFINHIYYIRILLFINIWLLLDIFRIYHDYLEVSKELKESNNKISICEEIKYSNIKIISILSKLNMLENKLNKIEKKIICINLSKNNL